MNDIEVRALVNCMFIELKKAKDNLRMMELYLEMLETSMQNSCRSEMQPNSDVDTFTRYRTEETYNTGRCTFDE